MSYSCIIPFFNEAARIGDVLKRIVAVPKINQIICVDDGSTDDSSVEITSKPPKVLLVKHKINQGRTAAVASGLKITTSDNVILMDADLEGLEASEISKAIRKFEDNKLDCLILSSAPTSPIDSFMRKIFRVMLCIAGCRIIRRELILEILSGGNVKGYQLEIAENKFLMDNNLKVAYMDFSAMNPDKTHKRGLAAGLRGEINMWRQIISYGGLIFLLKQSFTFARKKIF